MQWNGPAYLFPGLACCTQGAPLPDDPAVLKLLAQLREMEGKFKVEREKAKALRVVVKAKDGELKAKDGALKAKDERMKDLLEDKAELNAHVLALKRTCF